MKALFGEDIGELKYYWLREVELDGIPLVVSRTGWSSELGYELYLRDGSRGDELWEKIMAAGRPFGSSPATPRRSAESKAACCPIMPTPTSTPTPIELGLDRLVNLDMDADFIGKEALRRIHDAGVSRRAGRPGHRRSTDDGTRTRRSGRSPINGSTIGKVTSAVYSPRLDQNIALAMVAVEHADIDTVVEVETSAGPTTARVVVLPFYDPTKSLATTNRP